MSPLSSPWSLSHPHLTHDPGDQHGLDSQILASPRLQDPHALPAVGRISSEQRAWEGLGAPLFTPEPTGLILRFPPPNPTSPERPLSAITRPVDGATGKKKKHISTSKTRSAPWGALLLLGRSRRKQSQMRGALEARKTHIIHRSGTWEHSEPQAISKCWHRQKTRPLRAFESSAWLELWGRGNRGF